MRPLLLLPLLTTTEGTTATNEMRFVRCACYNHKNCNSGSLTSKSMSPTNGEHCM